MRLTVIGLCEKALHCMVNLVTRRHQLSLITCRAEIIVAADEALVPNSTEATLHATVTADTCNIQLSQLTLPTNTLQATVTADTYTILLVCPRFVLSNNCEKNYLNLLILHTYNMQHTAGQLAVYASEEDLQRSGQTTSPSGLS